MVIVALLVLILFTFLTELMYGIFHFNYNQKPIDLIKVRQYALLIKQDYALYKKTNDDKYKDKKKASIIAWSRIKHRYIKSEKSGRWILKKK
jgi:hypothetical protein